jgi:ubiquitin C-terminal hydrolase
MCLTILANGSSSICFAALLSSPSVLLLHLKRFIVVERPIVEVPSGIENASPNRPQTSAAVEYILRKNKAPVSIPSTLSLDEFLSARDDPESTLNSDVSVADKTDAVPQNSYSLKSIVYHIGARASSGHYTADAERLERDEASESSHKQPKPVWVSFDDTFTSRTSLDMILNNRFKRQSAYMLLYVDNEDNGPSGSEEPIPPAVISPAESL